MYRLLDTLSLYYILWTVGILYCDFLREQKFQDLRSNYVWNFFCETCTNDFKYGEQFVISFLGIIIPLENNPLTIFVLFMNGQPQALQQLPVSVVNLVYDVQWEYDDKLKPTINSIMFHYIRDEWNFINSSATSTYKSLKFLQGP